ncbi:hypothetical protein Tco_1536673, partial [Tanacetum coccineum]
VMAFSIISISSDSSKESVGTSTARVILFDTIPTIVLATAPTAALPVIHDDTPLIPTDTPIVPTIPSIAPTIQYTSPFVCTDSSDSDTPDTPPSHDPYEVTVTRWRSRVVARSSPPSPIHDTPPTEISPSTRQILLAPPGLPRQPAIFVLPGQPIPVGRPYRTQPNGVLKMLTARKRVGPLSTHRLALRYLVDYSSSDHFTLDDSSRDSLSDSSSETSSDSHSDISSDSSSRHSLSCYAISDSPCDSPTAILARPYLKRCRRIRDSDSVTNFKVSSEEVYVPYVPRQIGLGVDVVDSYEPYTEPDIDLDVYADIDACIAFADDIAARGTNIGVDRVTHRVVSDDIVEPVREDLLKLVSADGSLDVMQRGLNMVMHELYDHMVEIPVHRVRVIESV